MLAGPPMDVNPRVFSFNASVLPSLPFPPFWPPDPSLLVNRAGLAGGTRFLFPWPLFPWKST